MSELNRKINKKKWFPKRKEAQDAKNKVALIKPAGVLIEEPIQFSGPTHHTTGKILKL